MITMTTRIYGTEKTLKASMPPAEFSKQSLKADKNEELSRRLLIASRNGRAKRIISLVTHGANPNAQDNSEAGNRWTPLMFAVENNRAKAVKTLIGLGASVNARDRYGQSALMLASRNGSIEIVRMLVEKGAEIDTTDGMGRSAILIASLLNKTEIAKYLKERLAEKPASVA